MLARYTILPLGRPPVSRNRKHLVFILVSYVRVLRMLQIELPLSLLQVHNNHIFTFLHLQLNSAIFQNSESSK